MGAVGIDLLNFGAFQTRFAEAMVKLGEDGGLVLESTGQAVAENVRSLAPVGSGEEDVPGLLRDSIHVTRSVDSKGPYVEISADVPYAAYLEFGTSKMAPRPYFRVALASAKLSTG